MEWMEYAKIACSQSIDVTIPTIYLRVSITVVITVFALLLTLLKNPKYGEYHLLLSLVSSFSCLLLEWFACSSLWFSCSCIPFLSLPDPHSNGILTYGFSFSTDMLYPQSLFGVFSNLGVFLYTLSYFLILLPLYVFAPLPAPTY